MPELERGPRTYAHNQLEQVLGFQLNLTAAATVLRDGTNVKSASKMFTVTRVSAGLYTILLDPKTVWPSFPFVYPHIEQAATPVAPCKVHFVKNSYTASPGIRSFQIQIQTVGTAPAASDGDAGDRITILLKGGADTAGIDPA